MNGQWYLPWMQKGQVVVPQQPLTQPQQPLSSSINHAVSENQHQLILQQQYIQQQQQQLLKYLNQQAAGQQQSYLNIAGFIHPQQPQALINPASYIGLAAQAQHQPQSQISPLTTAAGAASKLPLLRIPSTPLVSPKVRSCQKS